MRSVASPAWLVPTLAGLVGGVAMTAALGPSIVHPTNIDWLMHGDYGLHFVGWHMYRYGPWTMPIGATPLLIWPVGSSIGLTDSIPIAAFVFKPFSALLPPVFQFIGLWLVLCVALQGVFGALLMRRATERPALQLLGALLLVLSPPQIFRLGHAALAAHWLLLAALWLCLDPEGDRPATSRATGWALLMFVTAAVQPYLLLMVAALTAAAHLQQVIGTPRRIFLIGLHGAAALAAAWLGLWQSGSFMVDSGDGLTIGGFGAWSTNLLSFIMPTEAQTLFSPGPIRAASQLQYEGYAYLGAGTLLLGVIGLGRGVLSLRHVRWSTRVWRYLPLALALLFLAAMAVGPIVTAGPRTLLKYDAAWWGPLRIFRTHGRMIWPLFYAVVVAILFAATRFRPRVAHGLLTLAVAVQAVDLAGMRHHVAEVGTFGYRDPLASRFWAAAVPHYERMVLVPSNLCTRDRFIEYWPFSLIAGRHGLAINAGVTARYDVRRAETYCAELDREIAGGLQTPGSLYVVRRDLLPQVAPAGGADRPTCTIIDGFGVCYSAESYQRWQQDFEIPRAKLPPIEELERFYALLDDTYRTMLGRGPRSAPDSNERRVDLLTRYLADRLEGCTHDEASARTLTFAAGDAHTAARCHDLAQRPEVPPADQTAAFATALDATLARRPGTRTETHVDLEGEAVWLQAYLAHRLQGRSEREAREAVVRAIGGVR